MTWKVAESRVELLRVEKEGKKSVSKVAGKKVKLKWSERKGGLSAKGRRGNYSVRPDGSGGLLLKCGRQRIGTYKHLRGAKVAAARYDNKSED